MRRFDPGRPLQNVSQGLLRLAHTLQIVPLPWEEDDEPPEPEGTTLRDLVWLIERQQESLVAVATGTNISSLDAGYRARGKKIRRQLAGHGIEDPYPWTTLSLFWGRARDYATYQERREWLDALTRPVVTELERRADAASVVTDWGAAPVAAWRDLEARLDGLKDEVAKAKTLDDRQDVGRRAREVMIDAVNLCYADEMSTALGEVVPKAADAKNRFDHILRARTAGRSHEELRKVMRAAWDLAQDVTHSQSEQLHALATAQAVVLLVRCLQEIAKE